MLFGAMLGCCGVQVGGLGGPSWRFGWLFGVYVGSCGAPMGVWEVQRLHGRGLEGLGLAQGAARDPDLGPTWVQLEASWTQLGATMGST